MRLNINLASRKYEEVRRFYLRWSVILAVLAGLTVILATLAGFSYARSAKSGREIKDLQQKVAALQKQRDALIAVENLPANRDVTLQKNFWNAQLAKRNLSWTQLFNDLQKIMPDRAFLNSVKPELTRDNRLMLKLVIASERQDDARELQKRMEDSARFRAPFIEVESRIKGEKSAPPLWKFEIGTEYAPASAAPQPRSPQERHGQGATMPGHSGTKGAG
jgi:Tfp pilus assembly protein PilN